MSDDANLAREDQAKKFEGIAEEATRLAEHARVAATHFRSGAIARAGAHALALHGHLVTLRILLDEIAIAHAARSSTII